MRRLLRILLKTLKWTGLALSTLLLAGIVVLWVRSVGHMESWMSERFEPMPNLTGWLAGAGQRSERGFAIIHGRVWIASRASVDRPPEDVGLRHQRETISDEAATEHFVSQFAPGERSWHGGTAWAWRYAGLGIAHRHGATLAGIGRADGEEHLLAIPFWMLAAVFGLWPLLFATVRLLRRKRRAPHECPACGYDLRATPDPAGPRLARCPECGREVASVAVEPKPAP